MNRKSSKLIVITLLIFMCALVFGGCTVSSNPYPDTPDSSIVMKSLDVTIDASKGDRSMLITESYVYNFVESRHGFYRDFAINSGERIRDIKVSAFTGGGYSSTQYGVRHENGNMIRVKVGDDDYLVPTNVDLSCTISYTMITPKVDNHPDTLMINAIGQGFSCQINSARVKVILPQGAINNEYYVGGWGSNNASSSKINETHNEAKTEYILTITEPLKPFNGLTVYYGMPSGAFSQYIDWQFYITLAIAITLIILAVLAKVAFGKSETITPITNFYPPKGNGDKPLNPVEMGFLIDNTCSGADVTSLIFYWASKGYIKIANKEEEKDILLQKVKNISSDAPEYEVNFFNKIFGSHGEVLVSELTNTTYQQVTNTQNAVKSQYSGKLYSPAVKAVRYVMCAAICLFAFLTIFLAYLRVSSRYINIFAFVALAPIIVSNVFGVYIVNNWLKFDKGKVARLVGFFALTLISSLLLFLFIHYDVLSTLELCALVAGIVAPTLIAPFIVKRTKFYTAQLNEIMGFREFLLYAEKDKLEMLLKENPEYYYDILPYANVLGVSSIWEKKFESLTLSPPSYYSSDSVLFDMLMFNAFYRSAYRSVSTVVASRPNSSSRSGGGGFGGFGGGGGFSGGGFGGGGGGSW